MGCGQGRDLLDLKPSILGFKWGIPSWIFHSIPQDSIVWWFCTPIFGSDPYLTPGFEADQLRSSRSDMSAPEQAKVNCGTITP